MPQSPIFYDPQGRRGKIAVRLTTVIGVLVALLLSGFVLSLLATPFLPQVQKAAIKRSLAHKFDRQRQATKAILIDERKKLYGEIARLAGVESRPSGAAVVAGFYPPWQDTALASFRANASALTHVIPLWLKLDEKGTGLDFSDWNRTENPGNRDVIQIARRHGVKIMPLLSNAREEEFEPGRIAALLDHPDRATALCSQLVDWLQRNRFDGLNLDFENIPGSGREKYRQFVGQLSTALHAAKLEFSADLEVSNIELDGPLLAKECDFVVLMAYDEHYESGQSGPIASASWVTSVIQKASRVMDPSKVVVGTGSYAYDWIAGKSDAASLSYEDALVTAADNHEGERPENVIDFDERALNSTFEYEDEQGKAHEVWMLDAASVFNQWTMMQRSRVRGAALWSIGTEDPSIWKFFHRDAVTRTTDPHRLETIAFPYEIDNSGVGELLTVLDRPAVGSRSMEVDPASGLITNQSYQKFPSSYVIQHSGFKPKLVALTFDDGPSGSYSPMILDGLKELKVPATFFVIGSNAEQYPGLVQRMYDEGHEIGSHTYTHPNLGTVSPQRIELELNTAQRAIESITGHSTVLFRPPYNADANPETSDEVTPIDIATRLGYVTVGEYIDPQDWNTTTTSGQTRTGREMAQEVVEGIQTNKGNIVLLHDGGGDRTETVICLRLAVPALQKLGYRFVTVSELAGKSREQVMPAISNRERFLIGIDRIVFEVSYGFEYFLAVAFFGAIGLGIFRALAVTILAFFARSKTPANDFAPPVSVLIAAFNESKVINRTIDSILSSDYPSLRVVVVDDGSTDGTASQVRSHFGDDDRVLLVTQENGGKASALNTALAETEDPLVVCFDADTIVAKDAISRLVQGFEDSSMGAVAGNVKVGNRVNLITHLQSVEYITSQNLDRRAYSLLNAITVVPGAIGAWRRTAIMEVGGYLSDTLAEDMDLTWRLRRAGWKATTANDALAFTEAPEHIAPFFRQRFRWAFGTLQCLWKHRGALLRHGWFGWIALPTLWLFQVVFQLLAPLVDLQIIISLISCAIAWFGKPSGVSDWQPLSSASQSLWLFGFMYAMFFAVELVCGLVAFSMDRERKGPLAYLLIQRVFYRQIMYGVIWKSIATAVRGRRTGWGKQERKGSVGARL